MKKKGLILRLVAYVIIVSATFVWSGMNDRFSPVDLNSDGSITGATSITASGAITGSSVTPTGLTANRVVRTNASKVLTSNAALTAGGVVIADASGFPATDTDLTFATNKLTVTNLDVSTASSVLSASASTLARFDAAKKLESNAALTAGGILVADASGWPSTDTDITFATNKMTVTNLDVSTNLKVLSATVSKVAKIDSSGYVTSGTASDASMEAVIAPILIDASGAGGTTLTATMMQSAHCQFTNIGQTAVDASVTLPAPGPNMHCQGTVVTAQTNKWGVYDSTGTMTVIDSSGAMTTASTYAQFDNAVLGQSFDVWTQKITGSTYGWFAKARAIGLGRTFTQ